VRDDRDLAATILAVGRVERAAHELGDRDARPRGLLVEERVLPPRDRDLEAVSNVL
jgi:hypothetical protein